MSEPDGAVGRVRVRLPTALGDVVIETRPDRAPKSAAAFLHAVDVGLYTGATFIRTVRAAQDRATAPVDLVQVAAAEPVQMSGSIEHESTGETGLRHVDGAVSLPRGEPGTASAASFFVTIGDQPALDWGGDRQPDGQGFAVFGQVVEGMDIVRRIHHLPTRVEAPLPEFERQILSEPVVIALAERDHLDASGQLAALAEAYWAFKMREFPTEATAAGDRRYNDRLEGMATTDFHRRARQCEAMRAKAERLDETALSQPDQITLGMLKEQLDNVVTGWRLGDHLTPKLFPFGFYALADSLAQITPLETGDDICNFLTRLEALPKLFDESVHLMRAAAQEGFRTPSVLLPRAIGVIDAYLAKNGAADRVRRRIKRPIGTDDARFVALQERAEAAIASGVIAPLKAFRAFLEDEADALCRDSVSICDQPFGRDYYRFKVRQQTSVADGPDDLHDAGLSEVAAIHAEIASLLAHQGEDLSARAYAERLSHDPAMIDPTSERLLERTRALAKRIDGQLPRFFGRLPGVTYAVEGMTPEQSREMPPALAQPGPADRSMPGVFWLTGLPEKCPRYMLMSLTLHEAWPGHLMQFALAHEMADLPAFRRFGWSDYNAYIEGWALYCERLGHDMGLYDDPRDEFGRLANDLWRASRLVLDTGLHWKGWTRERAITWMTENTVLEPATIASEIDRYIGMPAQALSYKVGERSFRALRTEAETRLGPAFSLRSFHDAVLATGPVGLGVLEGEVRRWTEGKASQ